MSDNVSHPPGTSRTPETTSGRRTFLSWAAAGLGGLATLAVTVPFVGYLLGPLLRPKEDLWKPLGPVKDFPTGETRSVTFINPLKQPWDGMAAQIYVFVRRLTSNDETEQKFVVFAANCAHLGCPVTWFPQSKLFLCPCHGGVYYENGERASGRPPRGLFHCDWRVNDGQLELQAPHLPTLHDTLAKGG